MSAQSASEWYEVLAKPSWAPAPPTFGIVWTILYPIIFVAYGYVLVRVAGGSIPKLVALPVVVNLAANFAFTPILFGLHNLDLAVADIVIVLATVVWSIVVFVPYSGWAALALVPYLVWVTIATVLQISITLLNR